MFLYMAVRRRRAGKRRKALKIKVNPTVAREIWAVVYLAIGILTVLSIQGAFGVIGNLWIGLLGPILGWGIFIVPGLFIVVSAMMFFSKKIKFGASRTLGFVFFIVSFLSILHLSVPLEKIHEYAVKSTYGGYVGFVTNFLLLEVLKIGSIAATVIFIALFLVSLLLIFDLSLVEIVKAVIPKIEFDTSSEKKIKDKKESSFGEILDEDDDMEIKITKAPIVRGGEDSAVKDFEEENKDVVIDKKTVEEMESSLSDGRMEVEQEETDYEWEFPSMDLLKVENTNFAVDDDFLVLNADRIKKKLRQFGIEVVMHEVNVGPTVIQYTFKPHEGVKLSKITTLKNDIALALAAERVRIEAPIPGKSLVGIEIPNQRRANVYLREMLESKEFIESKSKLTLPLGRDVSGRPVVATLDSMPHLLVAGATGSGKSVAMNVFLISLLYQNSPKDLRLILVDPKMVELSSYNSIPHLLTPVIKDPEKAAVSLRWVVSEMTRRYGELSNARVRNITEYNELAEVSKLPKIVVVIDELADLMMAAGKEVEASICRIAQMARAVGIYLIIATQRPSVDVITGLIKANIPSRISFAVSSSIDSRTILDGLGAEDLLGRGDMLYLPPGRNKPQRIQGIFVTTDEIERVTNRVKLTVEPSYNENITSNEMAKTPVNGVPDSSAGESEDSMYVEAYDLVMETRKASASLLQRRLKVGYARAARLIDLLEENGIVGPPDGAKPRKILVE